MDDSEISQHRPQPLSQNQIKQRLGAIPIPSLDFAQVGERTLTNELDLIVLTLYHAQFGLSAVTGTNPERVNFYVEMAKKCCRRLRINPENIIACISSPATYKLPGTSVDLSNSLDWTAEIEVRAIAEKEEITKQLKG